MSRFAPGPKKSHIWIIAVKKWREFTNTSVRTVPSGRRDSQIQNVFKLEPIDIASTKRHMSRAYVNAFKHLH